MRTSNIRGWSCIAQAELQEFFSVSGKRCLPEHWCNFWQVLPQASTVSAAYVAEDTEMQDVNT